MELKVNPGKLLVPNSALGAYALKTTAGGPEPTKESHPLISSSRYLKISQVQRFSGSPMNRVSVDLLYCIVIFFLLTFFVSVYFLCCIMPKITVKGDLHSPSGSSSHVSTFPFPRALGWEEREGQTCGGGIEPQSYPQLEPVLLQTSSAKAVMESHFWLFSGYLLTHQPCPNQGRGEISFSY